MCGIFAIYATNHNQYKYDPKTLAHRGPDNFGEWSDPHIYLAHHRLSIIDLSDAAKQPMPDSSGRYRIIYNGEIYNFRDIRGQLEQQGITFTTQSDTEVAIEALAHYGPEAFKLFRGMFAIVIYDTKNNTVTAARDRFGIKPLLFSKNNDGIAFSSEAKALHSVNWTNKAINQKALESLFTHGSVAQPMSLYENIETLLPGHYITIDQNFDVQSVKYCDMLDNLSINKDITFEQAVIELRQKLEEVIALNCVSDTDVGCFLSGGVDSTSILALMKNHSDHPIKAFSLGFQENETPDETGTAQRSAKSLNADFKDIIVSKNEIETLFLNFIDSIDQPSIDGFNTFIVSHFAAKDVKVVLSGIGGDELFLGYHFHRYLLKTHQHIKLACLKPAKACLEGLISRFPKAIFKKALQYISTIEHATFIERRIFTPYQKRQMLQTNTSNFDTPKSTSRTPTQALSIYEIQNYMLSTLLRDSDVVSMAHGLEIRPPLLDHTLVRYVLELPDHLKFSNKERAKNLFIQSVKDLIPEEVYNNKKAGFELPYASWMNNEFRSIIAKAWLTKEAAEIYKPAFIKNMAKKVNNRRLKRSDWLPCVFLIWYLRQNELTIAPTHN